MKRRTSQLFQGVHHQLLRSIADELTTNDSQDNSKLTVDIEFRESVHGNGWRTVEGERIGGSRGARAFWDGRPARLQHRGSRPFRPGGLGVADGRDQG